MKRTIVLLTIAILSISLIAGSFPLGKKVGLTINNKSGATLYMSLDGKFFKQHYYLVIPNGVEKTYTIIPDQYKRTTWACDGIRNNGSLIAVSKTRLTFTPCFQKITNFGEPGNEKVAYFPYTYVEKYSCGYYFIEIKVWKTPVGCLYRYQYYPQ
jgi:hypothetical protein